MRKNITLLKPTINTVILNNEIREKADFLDIPDKFDIADFETDVRLGAVHYKEIRRMVEKEREPRYILITTDSLEHGYMAVTYLAALFNEKHGKRKVGQEFALDEEEWCESAYAVPIIKELELRRVIGRENEPFTMGNMFAQADQRGIQHFPYWMKCRTESVCIVSNGYTGGFGGMFPPEGNDSTLCECMDYFIANDKVYILNIEQPVEWEDELEDDFEEEENWQRAKWNYLVLSFSIDEISVKLKEKDQKKYYKAIFRGVVEKQGMQICKGFMMEKVMNLILKMKERDKCKLIQHVVKYATKDWEESRTEITNQDFAFLDRFIRSDMMKKKGEDRGKNTARDILKNSLIGMESVKEQVLNVINVMKYNKLRAQMHIKGGAYHNVHIMLGAPGTAKTTVAGLMGQIMMEEHLLPDNRFVCVNGAELKGMYVGHSAPKTKALFEENDIIVIDEAYSLVGDGGECDSFSKEAIAQLIIELEKHSMDKLIIFAGYGGRQVSEKNNKMKNFLDANPGIKSRITSTIYFDSYTPDEMTGIFFKIAENQKYQLEEGVEEDVTEYFRKRVKDENFGNGREARSLLETSVIYAARRVMEQNKKRYTKAEMQTITREDVICAIEKMRQSEQICEAAQKRQIGFCAPLEG